MKRWIGPLLLSASAHAGLFLLLVGSDRREPVQAPNSAIVVTVTHVETEAPPPTLETKHEPTPRAPKAPGPAGRSSSGHRAARSYPAPNSKDGVAQPRPQAVEGEGATRSAGVATREELQLDLPLGPPAPPLLPGRADTPNGRGTDLHLVPKAGGGYAYSDTQFDAEIEYDGQVEIDDDLLDVHGENGGLAIGMDLTDMLMRANGDDPYLYEKSKFMRATKELRFEMAKDACRDHMQEAVVRMKERLAALWSSPSMTSGEKRALLFELWDECAEEGNEAVVLGGNQIRATIVAFIQRRLPRGSPFAYTNEELAALNRKRSSKQRFAPYDG